MRILQKKKAPSMCKEADDSIINQISNKLASDMKGVQCMKRVMILIAKFIIGGMIDRRKWGVF
jgi:hypothetical protein